jgi:asparagine synthase (glutamine-hydrolysing)
MCGIFGHIIKNKDSKSISSSDIYKNYEKVAIRGPNRSKLLKESYFTDIYLGFHRLAIMDTSTNGDQPFVISTNDRVIYCLCNGEIYDYSKIVSKYKLQDVLTSKSDCEVIPHLYLKHFPDFSSRDEHDEDISAFVSEFKNAEFACCIIDLVPSLKCMKVILFTDPTSVRPLFFSDTDNSFQFSSIAKGIFGPCQRLRGGSIYTTFIASDKCKNWSMSNTYCDFKITNRLSVAYNRKDDILKSNYFDRVKFNVRKTFESIVSDMLQSDVPIGALLSGGLDSSLVVSIASRYYKNRTGNRLKTFSVGMKDGTDEKYAKMVSEFCDTDHQHIIFTEDDFIGVIPKVVEMIETHDVTSIRASTGQFLISRWISENTDIKVLLVGDGSDELCSGYMYFHKAPSPLESHHENCRLLDEICLFDGLRADRCIAGHGLEGRFPFLNSKFIDLYLSLDQRLRVPIDGMEKWLLRHSFDTSEPYLPKEVLFRHKNAFSDSVATTEKPLYKMIHELTDNFYTDEQFEQKSRSYDHCIPVNKEALYYRELFNLYIGRDKESLIPHHWYPQWSGNITEPSATVLDVYKV